ncbi:MAG: outer membrane protein transport protein [bacterium]|nr:outer membrane protein transport protein [bacterium]
MKRLWLYSCLLLVAMTGLASAQITFDFTGAGARAEGMGRAYFGIADDASSITWNPAGLVSHDKPILGFSYVTAKPHGTFQEAGANGTEFKVNESFGNFAYLAFVSPVRIRGHQFVLAASYSQTSEDFLYGYFEQRDTNRAHDVLPTETYKYQALGSTEYHANPYVINFGFGTPVSEKIDIGVSLNVYTGKSVLRNRIDQASYEYEAIDRLLQEVDRDSSQAILDSTSFSGVNFTLAGKYKKDKLSIGAVVRTGFSLKTMADRKLSDSIWYNGQLKSGNTLYLDDQLTKYNIPWIFGVGFGYQMSENWLLALDAEYRGYASTKAKVRTSIKIGSGGNNEEIFTEIDPMFYDCFVVRTGTEYLLKLNSSIFPIVPLRAGVAYVPLPTPQLMVDSSTEKMTMYQLTAGTGVRWSQIWLDLSYVYTTYDQKTETVYNGLLEKGTVYNRAHRLNLTFTGYF